MPEDTTEAQDTDPTNAEQSAPSDTVADTSATDASADATAKPLVGEVTTTPRTVSAAERANVVDAIVGELRRQLEGVKNLKPAALSTLNKVAEGATTLAIDTRAADTNDNVVQKKLARRKANLDAQLANIKAIASDKATATFWVIVDRVITRLEGFALTTVVAAI